MPIPDFNDEGDLPEGIHAATLKEVVSRLGTGTAQREAATASLFAIYQAVRATGCVRRFLLFGSYVTAKAAPNDVDIVLVMEDSFSVAA